MSDRTEVLADHIAQLQAALAAAEQRAEKAEAERDSAQGHMLRAIGVLLGFKEMVARVVDDDSRTEERASFIQKMLDDVLDLTEGSHVLSDGVKAAIASATVQQKALDQKVIDRACDAMEQAEAARDAALASGAVLLHAAREALRRHGIHVERCPLRPGVATTFEFPEPPAKSACDCGLDAALKALDGGPDATAALRAYTRRIVEKCASTVEDGNHIDCSGEAEDIRALAADDAALDRLVAEAGGGR